MKGVIATTCLFASGMTPTKESVTRPPATKAARMQVDCGAPAHRISPWIYGIAYYPLTDAKDGYVWKLGASARRWGGNHSSRFNWRRGNAWNTAADWFYRNVNYTGRRDFHWSEFLEVNRQHGVATALTVPMLGWVAKDLESMSFPTNVYGPQAASDPHHPLAGNGIGRNGLPLPPGSPSRTSEAMPPSGIEAWVRDIHARDARQGTKSVQLYLLDNEPELWHKTHRDVHPEPLGYDELLQRTIAYGSAVRHADGAARIAGPAAWGWPAYFFSAKDADAGFWRKPDRRAHGDVPLLAWYLRELRAHERKTGIHILDVLDVHYYPQDLPKEDDSPSTAARRLRATRSLWDPTYKDESWIAEPVALLPRMQRLIRENNPGLGLMIGEYNFGGAQSMSGALAQAEALGRFAAHEGLVAAFYWTYPPEGSPAYHAFRAFRNYDGRGGRFLDWSVPARSDSGTSLFVSRDADHERMVAVALNLESETSRQADIELAHCGAATSVEAYRYTGGPQGLGRIEKASLTAGHVRVELPPYSITVLELRTGMVAQSKTGEASR